MEDTNLFQTLDRAASLGKFGENYKLVSLIPSNIPGKDCYASEVVFAEVKLQKGFSQKSVHVVIKKQLKGKFARPMMIKDVHFYNEVLMYTEILPSLEKHEISVLFPKYVYGRAMISEDDIVIMEDLRQDGFRLANEKYFLDFDHCVLILKKLARFHALSYVKKQENFEEFCKLVHKLKEVNFTDTRKDKINKFLEFSIFIGVLNLEKLTDEYKTSLEKMKKIFEDPFTMMKTFCQPEEPMAVVCHGDFCRNNMIFRYDVDGKPVDVRFFDVATARYSSPAIDLSLFLLMNTTTELRRDHWEDFFEVYHEALTSAITPDCIVPSLEDIKQDVRAKALYGYTHSSFFIPFMMEEEQSNSEDCASKSEEAEKSRLGEPVEILTDIVRDLIKLGCV